MARKPILTFSAKDFLTGVSGSEYSGRGGLFAQSWGVSAVRGAASFRDSNVGLLQGGPSGTAGGSGVVVDAPIYGARNSEDASFSYLYVIGSGGHIYKKQAGGAPTDLGVSSQIPSPANGLEVYKPASGGTKYLYYWQAQQIGRVSVASAPAARPTSWTDNWSTGLQNTQVHPTHVFLDRVYYGNDYYVGCLSDDGAGDVTNNKQALDFPQYMRVNAVEDDGVYLVVAVTADKQTLGNNVVNKIVFWDTNSSSWQREYPINDIVLDMKRVGSVVWVLGGRGLYTVSFIGGVQKINNRGGNVSANGGMLGPGLLSSFGDALVFGGGALDTDFTSIGGYLAILGKPNPLMTYALHTPIIVDDGPGSEVSFIDAEWLFGNFVVGNYGNAYALKEYAIGVDVATQQTGKSADTASIPLPARYRIDRIDVVLGRVLVTGDILTVKVLNDDLVTYTTVGTVSFSKYGAKRRVSLRVSTNAYKAVEIEDFKGRLTFTAGSVAVRKFAVYGNHVEPKYAN